MKATHPAPPVAMTKWAQKANELIGSLFDLRMRVQQKVVQRDIETHIGQVIWHSILLCF